MKTSLLASSLLVSLAFANLSFGQWHGGGHHHQGHTVHHNVPHGHDSAGHMVDSLGHHIDGHGHHTGSIGVMENGSLDIPWYPSNNVVVDPYFPSSNVVMGPIVSSTPIISSTSSVSYPSIINTAPVIRPTVNSVPSTVVRNAIPGTTQVVGKPATGGSIRLSNPAQSGGPISYTLNTFSYTMRPGESQTLSLDREWVLAFDNGMGRNVRYRLDAGSYEFTVNSTAGWDVGRRAATAEVAPPTPSLLSSAP